MATIASERPSAGRTRPAFEVFVAVLAAAALVAGMYALGRAAADGTEPVSGDGAQAAPAADGDPAAAGDPAHGHDGDAHEIDDRGFSMLGNGEQHHEQFTQPLDAATRQELARQLTIAREVALQYPTVADAEAAGFRRAGPFSPGLGAHYINFGSAAGSFTGADDVWDDDDIRRPLAFIYDGVEPGSRIAGLFYMANGEEPPEGFAGANDVWHKHTNVCVVFGEDGVDAPLGADREVTEAQCTAVGGTLIRQTGWLLHVWPVPGYESPEGVFSHLSSAVTCPDGTYYTIDLDQEIGTRPSVCRDAA